MPDVRTCIVVASLAALTGACASTGATPRPFPTPGPPAAEAHTAGAPAPEVPAPPPRARTAPYALPRPGADSDELTGTALTLRGTPYVNGGADPRGFDCSGFTQYVFAQHGIALPRAVKDQFEMGRAVRLDEVAPGDLMFFTTVAPGASHVAISLGGDEFVHAPSSAGVVRVEHVSASYWSRRFIAAHRVARPEHEQR